MAYIRLTNGKGLVVDRARSHKIWSILQGELDPVNKEQEKFITKIDRIWINWYYAPESYKRSQRKRLK